jgi:hypothetical protein
MTRSVRAVVENAIAASRRMRRLITPEQLAERISVAYESALPFDPETEMLADYAERFGTEMGNATGMYCAAVLELFGEEGIDPEALSATIRESCMGVVSGIVKASVSDGEVS